MNNVQKQILTIFLSFCLIFSFADSILAQSDVSTDITNLCKISVSSGNPKVLYDKKMNTYWEFSSAKSFITITIPNSSTIGGILVDWFKEPQQYNIKAVDQYGKVLNEYPFTTQFKCIREYFPIDEKAKTIMISNLGTENRVSELTIYSSGELPTDLQIWEPPVKKADLMVICAHQDDEFLFMGGVIPYYLTEKNIILLYMANCGRTRRGEALDGLWAVGMRNYPLFACFPDVRTKTLLQCMDVWDNEKAFEVLVENIRKFKPDVIVTHDINGEYGHSAHCFTAYAVREAIEKSANSTQYRQSAREYGTWNVKKLYFHLYTQNQIQFDWNKPLAKYNGHTALEIAAIGFSKHVSQQKDYSMRDGISYDNQKFGLAYTTVGEDLKRDDFFENISKIRAEPPQDARATDVPRKKDIPTYPENGKPQQNDARLIIVAAIYTLVIAFLFVINKKTWL